MADAMNMVAVYVDNLMFAMGDPRTSEKLLHESYNLKLKKTWEIDYHIGIDFFVIKTMFSASNQKIHWEDKEQLPMNVQYTAQHQSLLTTQSKQPPRTW